MKIKIISDSASNVYSIPKEDYVSVPMKIVTDQKEYVDTPDLDVRQMVEELRAYKGRSGTACPNHGDWLEAFGKDEFIICITITGKLSGSYNAARLAKEEYEEEFPERKVFVLDSLSAGPEMHLLIEKIEQLRETESNFETICEKIQEYSNHIAMLFALESMKNLANNGRISPAAAKIAGVLGIRAIGKAQDGELQMNAKCRGEKGALAEILKEMKDYGYEGGKVILDHCLNPKIVEKMKTGIQKEFPQAEVRIGETTGLCSFYAEKGGLMIGFETK